MSPLPVRLCVKPGVVLAGESVPAKGKIVSIFASNTDIIRKDRRDTYYGHKATDTNEVLAGADRSGE